MREKIANGLFPFFVLVLIICISKSGVMNHIGNFPKFWLVFGILALIAIFFILKYYYKI